MKSSTTPSLSKRVPVTHKQSKQSLSDYKFLLQSLPRLSFNKFITTAIPLRNPSIPTTPPSNTRTTHLSQNTAKMRFSTLTTSLVASLFISISLVEAAPFDPGAWCQILPQPCFLPPTGCQYCGSWDGHDAVVSLSICYPMNVAEGRIADLNSLTAPTMDWLRSVVVSAEALPDRSSTAEDGWKE